MRSTLILSLLAASPALAQGIPTKLRWSVDVHERRPNLNLGAFVNAEPLGKGWKVVLVCETTDLIRKKVIKRERHEGVAVRQEPMRLVMAVMDGGISRVTISFDEENPVLFTSYPACPTGPGNLSTGD